MRLALRTSTLASLFCGLAASPARAHIVGSRLGDFYGGALHPMTALPDVVCWLALGLLAGLQPTRWARWIVAVFPAGLLAGFAAGLLSGGMADPMWLDAALMVALGLSVAAAWRMPGPPLLLLAFALAVYRGAANASGVDPATDATLFAAGLTATGYAVSTLVAAAAAQASRSGAGWPLIAIRAGGSWIAAVGVMAGGYALIGPP